MAEVTTTRLPNGVIETITYVKGKKVVKYSKPKKKK